MCTASIFRLRRYIVILSALALVTLSQGCSDDAGVGRTFPVSGKLTLDNQPVTAKTTIVLFKPDASKGNTSPFEPTGTVDAEGNYKLTTRGKNGAPPGWYKVIVTARDDASPVHPNAPKQHRPVAKSLLPPKYGRPETTQLLIEVVESPAPGAYDLKMSK